MFRLTAVLFTLLSLFGAIIAPSFDAVAAKRVYLTTEADPSPYAAEDSDANEAGEESGSSDGKGSELGKGFFADALFLNPFFQSAAGEFQYLLPAFTSVTSGLERPPKA